MIETTRIARSASAPTTTRTGILLEGTPLNEIPSEEHLYKEELEDLGSFTIESGGARVTARATIDDSGKLFIRRSGSSEPEMTVAAGLGDWTKTVDPTCWQTEVTRELPAGTYYVSAEVSNIDMENEMQNRAYLRFEIEAQYEVIKGSDDEDEDKEEEQPVCDPCGCCSEDGSNTSYPADATPGSAAEECGGSVSPAAATSSAARSGPATALRYNSVWAWKAQLQEGTLTICPSAGRRMCFSLAEGDSVARPAALTQHYAAMVELQNADLSPCTTGAPAFWTLTEASGRRVRFDAANGTVAAVVAASGKVTTAADHAAQVQERFDAAGNLISCYSPTEGLMLSSVNAEGATVLSWYAPARVAVDAEGNFTTTGEPYKTSTHLTTVADGVETTTVTRCRTGLPAHTVTRVDSGNTVTITKGTGDEAIIHTWETTYPTVGLMQVVETLRKGSAGAEPATCTCRQRKRTAGGWLTTLETEGYGSPLARTTSYIYNAQFRVARINRPDGGYTEYSYDADGRVTAEVSPRGNGGLRRTRYVYAAASTRFYDNRPVKVYTDYRAAGSASWLNIAVVDYTYEQTAAVERTTARTYAAGVGHQQVTIEESYGKAPAYAYAAGKPKFSQDAAGVQTLHEYTATTEHGAVHLHTTTTQANGAPVAGQSRRTEEFIAADDTITFERESIWNGSEWLLLSTAAYEYDEERRPVKTTRGNGRSSTTEWMCCGKLRETDENGITTTYGYDSAHQLVEITRAEVKEGEVVITPETITTYTRDAAGRILSTRRDTGAMTTTESTAFDALGREVSRTDALGRVTTTAYSADGLTTTVTTPAGATLITQKNSDGTTARVSGTGQRELVYAHSLSGNCECTEVQLADGTVISRTLTNGFGQTVEQAQPNTLGGFICTRSEYNARGQQVKSFADTGADTAPTAPLCMNTMP